MHAFANLPARRIYLIAIGCMVCSTASFSLMNIFIRMLSEPMHTTVIVFWRNFFSVLLMLPWVLPRGAEALKTSRLGGHFWRAIIGIIGMESWFYCVATLPLNHAIALSFTAPLFTTIFAVLWLKERADMVRWAALIGGFIGVLIILRPNSSDMSMASLVVLFATSMWAIAGMLVKSLTHTEPPLRIVFYMALFMMLFSLPVALPHWQWPTLHQTGLLLCVALASTSAHLFLVRAYSMADIVKLMPFDFLRLIFTAIFTYYFFHETSDTATWVGAGIIVACAVCVAQRDVRNSQKIRE
jgi:drug/metabolite transporter (DMT)-like permease